MNNIELLNLKFVDREDETKKLNDFLMNKFDTNILWIDGESGYGKSYFIKNKILNNEFFLYSIFYQELLKKSSISSIDLFIDKIISKSYLSFKEFIKKNYKNLINSFSGAAIKALKLDDLTSATLEGTLKYITNSNVKEDNIKMIISYIEEIIKKQRIIIILDNFTECDTDSLTEFTRIFHKFYKNMDIKFILVTTHSILYEKEEMQILLSEKLHIERLNIKKFDNYGYFYDILSSKFNLNYISDKDLQILFNTCNGIPNKLKTFIRSLYFKDAIFEKDNMFYFKKKQFQIELAKNTLSFDTSHLNDTYSLIILKFIAIWGTPITYKTLLELMEYYYKTSFNEFRENLTKKMIELINLSVIKSIIVKNNTFLTFAHDSDYFAIVELLKEKNIEIQFLYERAYSYIMVKSNDISCDFKEDLLYLKALHSYNNHATELIEYNYEYICYLQKNKKYYQANDVIERCEKYLTSFNATQLLLFAQNYYDIGNYKKSISIIQFIRKIKGLKEKTRVYKKLLELEGQVFTELLQPTKAIEDYNELIKKTKNEKELLRIECLLQNTLFRTPQKFKAAEKIFKKYTNLYINVPIKKCPPHLSHLFRSSMNFLEGENSIEYLEKGFKIAEFYSDEEEKAKIIHNMAFENIRLSNYSLAEKQCHEAIRIFDIYSIHEKAHPLNNLGVLYLITKKYETAYKVLQEALFWNKSYFANYSIKINLLISEYLLYEKIDEESINEILKSIANENDDLDKKIYKKIYINLAWMYHSNGDDDISLSYLEMLKPYLDEEFEHAVSRYKLLYNSIIKNHFTFNKENIKLKEYYINIPFEPWLVTFNHD